jgi:hypothetical protein
MNMETRTIQLPKGGDLEVQLTPKFLDLVAQAFEISSPAKVTDDHIRMYVYGAFKNALDKAQDGRLERSDH